MADLSDEDLQRAKFAFEIYDAEGKGEIDGTNLGNVLRALNLNPTEGFIEKLGGSKKKGEKKIPFDEFLPIFSQAQKDKDQGVYEDFIECLKLYDKAENGLMPYAELHHILLTLGEKLEEKEVDEIFRDCIDPEDDEGLIPYVPFLARVCGKPVPKSIIPE